MNKHLLFIACLSLTFYNAAQNIEFERVIPPPPAPQIIADFAGVSYSSIAFSDVDGDSDQDVLITGTTGADRITKLYQNDGAGNFTEVTGTPFDGVWLGSIAFSDIDGDNDQDVLITGENSSSPSQKIAKLYKNDGVGNFTEVTGTPFEGVDYSSIAFSDVDGDGDQDVLITGENSSGQRIAKLYQNNGAGNFTEVTGTPFQKVRYSSIAFSDIDGDSDQDVLITGNNTSNLPISKLYKNDGIGNFTEVTGTPFDGVHFSSIAFSDIDGDNDQDVLITGSNDYAFNQIAKLYQNDGAGNFTEITGTPFDGVWLGSIAFSDTDGDNDQDVLITGPSASGLIAKLYQNDGAGNFTEVMGTPFDGVERSSIAFSDIDGDGDQDLLITGSNGSFPIAKLYQNDGAGNFLEVLGTDFDGVDYSSIAFSDIDGDGDQDVLITGHNGTSLIAKLYQNNGLGDFTEVAGTPFEMVWSSSIAFSDIDGDSDQDVLITGHNASNFRIAKLYQNDGAGNFTEVPGTPFEGVRYSSIAFSDIDGDNDQDVLITGASMSSSESAKLYQNDGAGNFTEVTGTPFEGVWSSSIAFSDIDGDSDQDVLITGRNGSGPIAKLYRNDGAGNFTEVLGTPFDAVSSSSVAFSDIDGDGDQDVLITGGSVSSGIGIAKLYQNDGVGNFTEVLGTPFEGVWSSSIAFSDIDSDGDQDVLITGRNDSNIIAKLYQNDGAGNFIEVIGIPFDGVWLGSIAFSDIDGDSDQDVLITGKNVSNQRIAKLYRNISCTPSSITLDIPSLPNITQACSVAILPEPTATNNCGTVVTGTTTTTFPITILGPTVVTWNFDDGDGNVATQNQNVIITDLINPVPDNATLTDILDECSVATITPPTATNCMGTITGTTTTTFPITTQGTTSVTWTYDDGNGNVITQNQNVIIGDVTDPVPDNPILADVLDECSVTSITAPTAMDNCAGVIAANTSTTFPISTQGTTIVTWTFDDGNGNIITQDQNVIITDAVDPVPDNAALADVFDDCSVTSITAPTAMDNCAGVVTANTSTTFPINTQGTTVITWTYDDGNGNIITQDQNVIITDATDPIPDAVILPTINAMCEVSSHHVIAPTAADNCTGSITATPDISFPITDSAVTQIVWTYDDGNGNTITQNQTINWQSADVSTHISGTTIFANNTNASYQWLDCDNNYSPINGATNISFTPIANGNYAVEITEFNCVDTSDCVIANFLGVESNNDSQFNIYPNPTNGIFTITSNQDLVGSKIKVTDSKGKIILEIDKVNKNKIQIDLDTYQTGLYLVQIQERNKTRIYKIIKD